MNTRPVNFRQKPGKPLRIWPGVVIVILQWFVRYVIPYFFPGAIAIGIFGGFLSGLAILVWWIFFSRVPRFERWTAIVLLIGGYAAASQIIDKSLATAMMGMMFPIYSVPVLSLALVIWAAVCGRLPAGPRRAALFISILSASGFWVLLRSDGMDGQTHQNFSWRWAKTSEERLLAQAPDKTGIITSDSTLTENESEWPGFRGINRDDIIHGLKIMTNWDGSPPAEMWRKPVGPGCSSFAVHGALMYTQEQRGEDEMVTCYNLKTGEPVWRHSDRVRFWDAHAGAGPRSTPTISNGRIYTLGATGILNVLDAANGKLVWAHNAAEDNGVKIPGWGYSGSPIVTDSAVIASVAGRLVAYDPETGRLIWSGPDGGESYSSPQMVTIDGIAQILFMNREGITSFAPASGKELWKLPLPGVPIVQPALINGGDILISQGDLKGMRRITVRYISGGWTIKELWSTRELKPYFNDVIVHKGHAYGFDGPYLVCIDIENGRRTWRGGRYAGELLLLSDQDLFLVLSEKGELALVTANPEEFREIARFPGIKGRTWNHPALAGDVLLVRNDVEMAAFRLSRQN